MLCLCFYSIYVVVLLQEKQFQGMMAFITEGGIEDQQLCLFWKVQYDREQGHACLPTCMWEMADIGVTLDTLQHN